MATKCGGGGWEREGSLSSEAPCPERGGVCPVKSHVQKGGDKGSLSSEVPCLRRGGGKGSLRRH